jgi:hypothetical protein
MLIAIRGRCKGLGARETATQLPVDAKQRGRLFDDSARRKKFRAPPPRAASGSVGPTRGGHGGRAPAKRVRPGHVTRYAVTSARAGTLLTDWSRHKKAHTVAAQSGRAGGSDESLTGGVANGGDLSQAEAMLMNQAAALQSVFVRLAERAMEQPQMPHLEAFMRLALRAQSQCRATLETLATIKNPPIVFAQQVNDIFRSHRARETLNLSGLLTMVTHTAFQAID